MYTEILSINRKHTIQSYNWRSLTSRYIDIDLDIDLEFGNTRAVVSVATPAVLVGGL